MISTQERKRRLYKLKEYRQHLLKTQPCQHCGSWKNLTIDHIIPKYLGGSNYWKNLRVLCQKCNLEKANQPDAVWAAKQLINTVVPRALPKRKFKEDLRENI